MGQVIAACTYVFVCVAVRWRCIGGIFAATRGPDGWLERGSVFILRCSDVGRFVIPLRCRVFHIAPHPWDHISSPHPLSPNRFIYRLRCTIIPPFATHACMLPQTRTLMQMQARSINTHFLQIKHKNTHKTHLYLFPWGYLAITLFYLLLCLALQAISWWDYNCSHIFLNCSFVTCKETKTCHHIKVQLGRIAIILNITRKCLKLL